MEVVEKEDKVTEMQRAQSIKACKRRINVISFGVVRPSLPRFSFLISSE